MGKKIKAKRIKIKVNKRRRTLFKPINLMNIEISDD